jgi:hypothetical protein
MVDFGQSELSAQEAHCLIENGESQLASIEIY